MEAFFPPGTDLSRIPSRPPPPGVTSNFVNPYSLAPLASIFIYVTLPPMVLFVGLRFYTRIKISRKVGIDDYLCALAAAVMLAFCGVMLTFVDKPAGRHMWDVPLSMITVHYVSRSTSLTLVYLMAAMLIKASILLLYRRLFFISTTANVMIWIGLFVDVVFHLVMFGMSVAYCVPRPEDYQLGGWLSMSFDTRCTKMAGPTVAAVGVVGTALDVYILLIPLVVVSGLSSSWRKKAGIFAVFFAGASACVFAVVGTAYRMTFMHDPRGDSTYTSIPMFAMNVGEVNVGIISACMPVVFVLFKGFTRRFVAWTHTLRYDILGGCSPSELSINNDIDVNDFHRKHFIRNGMPHIKGEKLPQVPKGTLTGLRSWMRNFNRTAPALETQTVGSSDGMLTGVSAEYDYHRQLKAGVVTTSTILRDGPDGDSVGTPSRSLSGEGQGRGL